MSAPGPDPSRSAIAAPAAATAPIARPELLAPAGDWECARAAVENGADAIYFGLTRFNARLRAKNFSESDLPELMRWLHRRGVRGYVTFNTLVFANELGEAASYLRTLIASGVDAAIVQDVGICRLIRRISPDFPIHASTQMTITSEAGVSFARELGCEVVVLARENSIREIAGIHDATVAWTPSPRLEVFVHGALCVAYSGQCLTSEALGGRSANRGECAQACRLPYELISDGRNVDLGDRRYLLSPQDLAGVEVLPGLVHSGVSSLKIEGRLKSPEYVASITRIYREALDRIVGTRSVERGTRNREEGLGKEPVETAPSEIRYEMEMAFSRGLHTGWLGGIDNQRLVHGRFGTKRGVYLGDVTRVGSDRVWLRTVAPVVAGDGIVFDDGRPEEDEEGGRIFELLDRAGETGLTFLHGAVDFRRIKPGQRVWKTSDPGLDRRLRQSFAGETPRTLRSIHFEVHGHAGTPMTVVARDDLGHVSRRESSMPLMIAAKQPLDTVRLREHLGRLGGTPFRLGDIQNRLEGPVLLPLSELNRLRREVVTSLDEQRGEPPRWRLNPGGPSEWAAEVHAIRNTDTTVRAPEVAAAPRRVSAAVIASGVGSSELVVLARTQDQIEAVLDANVSTIYCEFEDPRRYRDAVRTVRERGRGDVRIYVAPPRIFKPGEEWIIKQVRASEPDGYLVRNHEHLHCFEGASKVGDFSLNVANPLTAEYFVRRYGLERVTASYDLNLDQLEALLRSAPAEWFEITLHQHMPMFHMEHCVFCAFLSTGKDYRDCGRPCDRHDVRLRDRVGAVHPLKADAGCRNTVFNARAQTGADHASRLLAAGARRFRIELLDESPAEARRLIEGYRRLLQGEITGEALWREFKLVNQLGVTRGQMGRATGADLGLDRWTDTKAYAASW